MNMPANHAADQTKGATRAPSAETLARFTAIVGAANALADPQLQMPYLREWRDHYFGKAALILRPNSTAEVAAIMALANATKTSIVPQSGNTGLVGGQIPFETGHEIVLSLERMNRVRSMDDAGLSMICEAGVTLQQAQQAAQEKGRFFALDLPSRGSCRIGGNLGTNAGGINVLAYGNARAQVLGLEVVLADGRIWDGLRALKKDNTGYDLKDLFIGSEGTLGIITAAVLKLLPQPLERATAMVGFDSIDQAMALFLDAQQHGGNALSAFEVMNRRAIDYVLADFKDVRDPLADKHHWYALLEVSDLRDDGKAAATLQSLLEQAFETGTIRDAAIANSPSQALALWHIRENISEAQKSQGGSIKHDICVPIASIAKFIAQAAALIESLCPGARPVPFGHFGDGNIHYNVSQPIGADKQAFLDRRDEISDAVHALVTKFNGSISAEHGIGRLKKTQLLDVKSEVEMDMMRAIKAAFDPKGILNPGKLL